MNASAHYTPAPEDRIPFGQKLVYGLGAFVNNLLAAAIGGMSIVLNLGLGMNPALVGLLGALPRVDRRREAARLKSIRGTPPNSLVLTKGCACAPRCDYALAQCRTSLPALSPVSAGHLAACFVNVETGEPRS